MSNVSTIQLLLDGLDCANCAIKIEQRVNSLSCIATANLNFVTKNLNIQLHKEQDRDYIIQEIIQIVKRLEPDVVVKDTSTKSSNNSYQSNECTINGQHEEKSIITQSNMKQMLIVGFGITLFSIAIIFNFINIIKILLFSLSYLLIGSDVLIKSFKNISKGQIFDENFLMTIATIGAFAIGEYPEGVAVMLFYKIGEFFQDMAVNRSRKSITALMDIKPDYANLITDKEEKKLSPYDINIGDNILVKPGEKIPLDALVIKGSSSINTSALTGESIPIEVTKGDSVLSGSININGVLILEVTKKFSDSTVSKILDLVQNASNKKSPTENFITKFAKYYTPIVVFIATSIAIIPPLISHGAVFSDWIYRALVFLVVSCPCALVISIPLGFFGGIGAASRNGILIKGGNYLEALNHVDTIVFDKTGTLTKGVFEVSSIISANSFSDENLMYYGAYVEAYSNHPIAQSVKNLYKKQINKELISDYKEISGKGVSATIDGKKVVAGNSKLIKEYHLSYEEPKDIGTILYIAVNNIYAGCIIISDKIKEDSKYAIKELKKIGVNKTAILTGDSFTVGKNIAESLDIDEFYCELLPHNKVEILSNFENNRTHKKKIMFVGDGINDAPVLARADIGVAMGALGSDAAIEAADVVLMTDEPTKIVSAIRIARFTRRIIWQNIMFAFLVKALVLILGAGGLATMWEAVFADVGVALIAVLNAIRILNFKKY